MLLAQICSAEGLSLRDVRLESRAYSALASMSAAGCGIAVVLSTVGKAPAGTKAMPIHNRGKTFGVWFPAIWHRRRQLPSYMQAFVDTAHEVSARNFPATKFVP